MAVLACLGLALANCSGAPDKSGDLPQRPSERKALNDAADMLKDPRAQPPPGASPSTTPDPTAP